MGNGVGPTGVDVFTVEPDDPRVARARYGIVEAIDGAEQRGLAASGWSDEGGDGARRQPQVDVVQGLYLTVPEGEIPYLYLPCLLSRQGFAQRGRAERGACPERHV